MPNFILFDFQILMYVLHSVYFNFNFYEKFCITNRVLKGVEGWKMQLVSNVESPRLNNKFHLFFFSYHFLFFLFNANISSSRMPIIADFIFWSVSSLFSTWPTESISKSSWISFTSSWSESSEVLLDFFFLAFFLCFTLLGLISPS